MPANHIGLWDRRTQGIWLLVELQVVRTQGKRSLVLRRELGSFVVPAGGGVAEFEPELLVEHVTEATQGPPRVDVAEARRAIKIGREAAKRSSSR